MAASVVGSTRMSPASLLVVKASGRRSSSSHRSTGTIPHRGPRGFPQPQPQHRGSGAKTPNGGSAGKGAGGSNGGAGEHKSELLPRTAVMPGPVESEDDLAIVTKNNGTLHVSQFATRPRRPGQVDFSGPLASPTTVPSSSAGLPEERRPEWPTLRAASPTPFDRPMLRSAKPYSSDVHDEPDEEASVGGSDEAAGAKGPGAGGAAAPAGPGLGAGADEAAAPAEAAVDGGGDGMTDTQRSIGWGAVLAVVAAGFLALRSVDNLPVVEQALQILGAGVSTYVAAQYMFSKDARQAMDEQAAALAGALNGDAPPAAVIIEQLKAKVSRLQQERDEALAKLAQVNEGADAALEIALADRAAMAELVQRLEVERDALRDQVASLEAAVESIGMRMKGIDEMVTSELAALKGQNKALETLALQLAAERDAARAQAETAGVDSTLVQALTEQLDDAKAMTDMVKKVVEELREGSFGLTPNQEVYLRDQAKKIRSQYLDPTEPLSAQRDQVVKMADRMAEEFGAPEEWTIEYCEDYLRTSGQSTSSSSVGGVEAPAGVPAPEAETAGANTAGGSTE